MPLPERSDVAEDRFVREWMDRMMANDADDVESLSELVAEALEARRPRLAARLVQLLPDDVEVDNPAALERARRAASMLVHQAKDIELFNALDEAWKELRRKRMRRMMARQRHVGTGEQVTIPRVGRRPRRR